MDVKVKVTDWKIDSGDLILMPTVDVSDEIQPSVGIELCWNDPGRWWLPFLIIYLWNVSIQVGWLIDVE